MLKALEALECNFILFPADMPGSQVQSRFCFQLQLYPFLANYSFDRHFVLSYTCHTATQCLGVSGGRCHGQSRSRVGHRQTIAAVAAPSTIEARKPGSRL